MIRKSVPRITLTLLLIFMVNIQLGPMQVKAQPLELYHDDGEADQGDAVIANQILGWGVKFDHPETGFAYKIERVKFYIFMGQEPLRLFVYLRHESTSAYEKVFENIVGPLTSGWNIIDLTSYKIITEEDVVVGFNWVFDQTPYLGVDVDTESHSGTFETHDTTDFNRIFGFFNYMIRACVTVLVSTTDELKTKIEELGSEGEIDDHGVAKSLIAKLNVAEKLVEKGEINEAKTILEEDFIPQVQNLAGIHITVEAADILVQSAEYILSQL